VLRETGDLLAVVHAPAVFAVEVHAQLATAERRGGSELGIAGRVGVEVVHAEQKRVERRPGRCTERSLAQNRVGHGPPI
jgi:hypothetical protein